MPNYGLLTRQMEVFLSTEPYYVSALANASALLWESLNNINWAGFYIVRSDQSNGECRLVLGPFQGKTACIHIGKGKGVCGTSWEKNEVMVVPDVHEFPGHIACDSASRSEIVVPIHKDGAVVAVLDIDSPSPDRFSDEDKAGLIDFAMLIETCVEWI